MTNDTKHINWTTGDGRKADVAVSLITSETINADGDGIAVDCCKISIIATVDGKFVGSGIEYIESTHPAYAIGARAVCGKLGITTDNLILIQAAREEFMTSSEWQAKVAAEKKTEAINADYEKHSAMMHKVMGY